MRRTLHKLLQKLQVRVKVILHIVKHTSVCFWWWVHTIKQVSMRITLRPCNTKMKQNIIGLEFNSLPLPGAEAKKDFVRHSIQTCQQTPPHGARWPQAGLPSDERRSEAWRPQWTTVHLDMKFKFGAAGSYLSYKGWNVRDSFVTQETCCVVCACERERERVRVSVLVTSRTSTWTWVTFLFFNNLNILAVFLC
jgi:hypothetical protein